MTRIQVSGLIAIAAGIVRMSSNYVYGEYGNPQQYADPWIYLLYGGISVTELMMFYAVFRITEGWIRIILSSYIALIVFDVIKLFLTPFEKDPHEIYGVIIGGLFVVYQIWKHYKHKPL
jgi:hypothetical protein